MLLRRVRLPHVFLAAFLLSGVPNLAFSQDTPAESSAGGESSGAAGGDGNSSANQSADGGLNNESNGPDASASADANGTGTATNSSDPTTATASSTANADASLLNGVSTATGNATGTADGTGPAGTADKSVEANATATYGAGPNSADAFTKVDGVTTTSASAVRGVSADAFAPGGTEIEKVNNHKTIAIALLPDGTYSIAIASKKNSFAKAGVYDADYATLSVLSVRELLQSTYFGDDVFSAAKAAAAAYALAAQDFAKSGSWSRSDAFARGDNNPQVLARTMIDGNGWAKAKSKTWAKACVGYACHPQPPVAKAIVVLECHWRDDQRHLECQHPDPFGWQGVYGHSNHSASVAQLRSAPHTIHKHKKTTHKKKRRH